MGGVCYLSFFFSFTLVIMLPGRSQLYCEFGGVYCIKIPVLYMRLPVYS